MPQEAKRLAAAEDLLDVIPRVMRILASDLRRLGELLAPVHFQLMGHLYQGPSTLGDLAQWIAVSPPTLSRTVRTLEERGWVQRTPSSEDGRVVLAELTPAGRAAVEGMKKAAVRQVAGYLTPLSEDELGALAVSSALLRRVVDHAQPGGPTELRHEPESQPSPSVD
ncbi:MAG TPA: MarR family transcriptional regulator [Anaerolineales bacterium]|jgi:DNA-binding MarR family transcriptional regulator